MDIDQAFKQQINDQLRPDTSMLFLRVQDTARGDEILRRLRGAGFDGRVIRTNLSEQSERALQEALSAAGARA